VEFPEDGLNYISQNAKNISGINVYGTEEEFNLVNTYGVKSLVIGYRLVGAHEYQPLGQPLKYEW